MLKRKSHFGLVKCKKCKSEFIKKAWNNNYCKDCVLKKKRAKASEYFYKGKKRVCIICSTEFIRAASRPNKFCSRKCMAKNYSEKRKGRNNPAYRNGTRVGGQSLRHKQSLFQKNAKILKQQIIEKDGFLHCQICLVSSDMRFEIHHIAFRSEFPKHENIHNLRNLIYLCIRCHNWFHSKKARRRFLVEERQLRELFPEIVVE